MTPEQLKSFLEGKVVITPPVEDKIKPVTPLEITKAPREEPNIDYNKPVDTERLTAMENIRKEHGGLISDIPITSNYYGLRNKRRK